MLNERDNVRAGITALLNQGRQIWGDTRHSLDEVVVRLMVGVGDLARAARDSGVRGHGASLSKDIARGFNLGAPQELELKKELGNVILSTIRWIDDLGLDPLECLDLAAAAQEAFAKSKRSR